MTQPALLLVDFQKGFANPIWGTRNNPEAEVRAHELLDYWREKSWPIYVIRHDSIVPMSPLNPETGGNELLEWAEPKNSEILIVKHVNSAFIDTKLEKELRASGISKLVVTGATSDHCVSTTARMAANLGFEVVVVDDATFTFDRKTPEGEVIPAKTVHDVHLASLNGEFATVLTAQEVIAEVG